MGDIETNRLLQKISNELRSIDLQNLKHLCHGSIPLRELEKSTYPFELFRIMLQKRLIKPGNLNFLGDLLNNIGRSDLASKIQTSGQDDAIMQTESGINVPTSSPLERGLRTFLMQLSDELTQDNVESLKFVADLPVAIDEKIQTGRDLFKHLMQSGVLGPTQLAYLAEMLEEIHRRDLAEKVKKFQSPGGGGSVGQINQPAPLCFNPQQVQPFRPAPLPKQPTSHEIRPTLLPPGVFKAPARVVENVEPRYPVQAEASTAELLEPMEQLGVDEEEAMPAYIMTRRPRGIAVIVSNEHFEENPTLRDRHGNAKDVENLEALWQFLNFEVIVQRDLASHDIYSVMRDISVMDHSDFDCFVCCLLSHGANGGIYGTDCELVEIKDITAQFKGTACQSLANKPKLFFVQACRGQNFDRGAAIESDAVEGNVDDAMRQGTEPNESHFLLGYATPPGYVSWRSQIHGSWYISKLCEVFRKFCERFDVMTMMVKVNDEVSEAFTRAGYKQCPAPVVTLRKRIYFKNN